jgi:hypothetical protein
MLGLNIATTVEPEPQPRHARLKPSPRTTAVKNNFMKTSGAKTETPPP